MNKSITINTETNKDDHCDEIKNFMKRLSAYLIRYKDFHHKSWDELEESFDLNKGTLRRIAYRQEPVRLSTYIILISRLFKDGGIPKELLSEADLPPEICFINSSIKRYLCTPECPIYNHIQEYNDLKEFKKAHEGGSLKI